VIIELRKIIQAIDRNSKSLVRRVGLTMPQLVILRYIYGQSEVSVGVIAKNIHLSDATVTGILERLERRGFIAKRKSDSDRRRVLIKITEMGKELLLKAPPAMQEGFVANFSDLPGWNQTMIFSALQQLSDIMNAGSIPADPILMVKPLSKEAVGKSR
jgi:DNA-binding MarR family transcriptional regulator